MRAADCKNLSEKPVRGFSTVCKGVSFETAIIERYRRQESSVEEALIEMYLAGVSVRRVAECFTTFRYYCLMPVHARGGLTVTFLQPFS